MFSCIREPVYKCSVCNLPTNKKTEIVLYSLASVDHKVRMCSKNCFDIFRRESSNIDIYKEKK